MTIVVPAYSSGGIGATGASAAELLVSSLPLNRIAPAEVLKSTANANYPAENVDDYVHPERPWQPTTTGESWVGYDLGALKTGWLYASWITLNGAASFSLQTSTASDFASLVDDTTVTATAGTHPFTRRVGYLIHATTSVRYVRVLIPAHSGSAAAVGQLVFVDDALLVPQRKPHRIEIRQATTEQAFLSGGRQVIPVGPRQIALGLDWQWAYNYLAAQGDGNENALFENPNLQCGPADVLLVVPDVSYRPHWAMLARRAAGALGYASQEGIGAQMSFTYEEVIGGD